MNPVRMNLDGEHLMQHIDNIPFFEIEFDKEGQLHTPAALDETADFLKANAITDLLVMSHGWNNDIADARDLYRRFFAQAANLIRDHKAPNLAQRKLAILGIYWPSKKFTDRDLIPGGAAGLGGSEDEEDLVSILEGLKTEPVRLGDEQPITAAHRAALDRAQELVPSLEDDAEARREFVECIRSILPRAEAHPDDGSDRFFQRDPEELLQEAADPVPVPEGPEAGMGGVAGGIGGFGGMEEAGGAAGVVGDLFDGVTAGARRLLNFTTYYRMKARAGTVGARGLAPALATIHQKVPNVRLHMIGHSFGGRVVTAAAHALSGDLKLGSLSLLQAAFSHNGFARRFNGTNDGFFRSVVSDHKVAGPTIITHTRNDKAVGIAYPLASRVAGQNAAGLGDREDPYGGLGRNGAIFTPEARDEELMDTGHGYQLAAGALHNLKADRFIEDHGDIAGKQVVYGVLSAVAAV